MYPYIYLYKRIFQTYIKSNLLFVTDGMMVMLECFIYIGNGDESKIVFKLRYTIHFTLINY